MKKMKIIQLFIFLFVSTACFSQEKSNLKNKVDEKSSDVEFDIKYARQQEAKGWAKVPEILARINPPSFPDNTVELTEFGGKGDAITDNRPFFEKAITTLAENGGGKLIVSPGTYWVDGPIVMKSNIHIEIKKNAIIRFSSDPASYTPLVKQRWEGVV